jgi:PRTRC genetic system ThiF family protein
MRVTHHYEAPRYQAHFRIVLIGAGGNGSAILNSLPYLHQALVAWGHRGLDVTVIDHDIVSPTNCVRQPFGTADIGLNKATVLINRINLFHGLQWQARPVRFTRELNLFTGYINSSQPDLVISCVDTKAARAEMHQAFFNKESGPWRTVRYWLDLGNGSTHGQFVLGQPLNAENRPKSDRLRCATELFPEIMDTSSGEDDQPSCSAAEALERQEPFINQSLAATAMSMITRMLRYGTLDYHGAFYNAASGRVAPMPIDPEMWAKARKRQRRAHAAKAA